MISFDLAATTCRSGLNALTLANLHSGLVVHCGSPHALFDLSCHGQESLLDIRGILCGCFEEWNSKAISKFLKGLHGTLANANVQDAAKFQTR